MFYRSLSIFVAPQTGGESFGIVLAEAMAAGCPVVASDLEAFRAVSDDGTAASLFTTGDGLDCARHIRGLLKNPIARSMLAQQGFRRAQRYDWHTVVEDILKLYQTVLS